MLAGLWLLVGNHLIPYYKINTNAAVDKEKNLIGLGILIGNSALSVMATDSIRINASYFVAEALAILHGIHFAMDL
ncbi:hypothetical protein ACOSP7_017734 [Xanthoceras sorbifolium]